ncbi:MAG: HAMP domain-containing histidine kinase [Defluviitaleaceae bacterium]|nr:HAMP domain-containing histidine kinase [Defluviitaleaceae bacterium]
MEAMEMSAALAHEIKNPAAVALAHVNLLRLDKEEMPNLTHHLNHIEQALKNICALVHDMLESSYNRSDAYEVDLYKILTDILETYRAAWPEINFSLNIAETSLPCMGHETSLRMIFSNLIKNAVEAIEASDVVLGKIIINAAFTAHNLIITITDNATSALTQKPHSNGLGLAICRNLASGLGAELFSTPSENGGSAVTVRLRVTGCTSFA